MELPDWINQPVPDVEVDEHDDAVGKLVVASQEVEAWLAIVAHRLGAFDNPSEAARSRATQLVVKIRQRVELVPREDHDELQAALRRASALLAFRNAVVHAMPRQFAARVAADSRLSPPPPEKFEVEQLVGAALAGRTIADYFNSRISSWAQR